MGAVIVPEIRIPETLLESGESAVDYLMIFGATWTSGPLFYCPKGFQD